MSALRIGEREPGQSFVEGREYWVDPSIYGRVIPLVPPGQKRQLMMEAESYVRSSQAANYAVLAVNATVESDAVRPPNNEEGN